MCSCALDHVFSKAQACVLAMSTSMGQPSPKGWVSEQIPDPFAMQPMRLLHTQRLQPSMRASPSLSLHGCEWVLSFTSENLEWNSTHLKKEKKKKTALAYSREV